MIYCFQSALGSIAYTWNGEECSHIRLQEHDQIHIDEIQADALQADALQTDAIQTEHDDPVSHWLRHWFDGRAKPLPPLIRPATPFQAKMRQALVDIPVGEVRSYGEIARQLGTSARGMGQALGANPLPVLIPCHRVIAARGLGGFACGLTWKRKLLRFEGGLLVTSPAAPTNSKARL